MDCIVIDDDPLICDLIKHFCSKQKWISTCLAVGDGSQALQAINTSHYDFIFLDYNLPDLNGKRLLQLLPNNIPVVMVTSESDFGAESYDFPQVVDFLVKPVKYDRFVQAMLKIQTLKAPKKSTFNQHLVVKVGNDSVIIKFSDIVYMKSEGNYVKFFLQKEKILGLVTLKYLAATLPDNFIRIHKSFIVNCDNIKSISSDEITLISGEILPIGASYKEMIYKKFAI